LIPFLSPYSVAEAKMVSKAQNGKSKIVAKCDNPALRQKLSPSNAAETNFSNENAV